MVEFTNVEVKGSVWEMSGKDNAPCVERGKMKGMLWQDEVKLRSGE
jgi:hypothetical protein